MQAPISAKTSPPSTVVVHVPNQQYNRAAVLALIPEATKVVFGEVPTKNGMRFSAIFHFGTTIPPKVDKKALGIQITTYSQEVVARCGGAAGGGRVACAPAIRVVCAPPAPVNRVHEYQILRPRIGSMYNTPIASRLVRDVCIERGYTHPLKLSIFSAQEDHLLTARITTSGTIPMTAEEVHAQIYSTLCVYQRAEPVAHSL